MNFGKSWQRSVPAPKCCMSGYIGHAVLSHSMLEEGQVFLQKPFNRDSLNRKVREALDH